MNIVNKLTLRQLKNNKKRTLVTIIGVIISVAMIMGVITIGTSLAELLTKREIAASGYWHVEYKNLTKNQVSKIESDENTEETILTRDLGYSVLKESKNENKPYLFVKEFNKTGFENYPIELVKGRLPSNPNEVVISEHTFSNGKANYSIGDVLNLDIGNRYTLRSEDEGGEKDRILTQRDAYGNEQVIPTIKKEYRIVGIIKRPSFEPKWAPGYTLLSYVDENTMKNEKVNAQVIVKKLDNNIYKDVDEIAGTLGIKQYDTNIGVLKWSGVMSNEGMRGALYGVVGVVLTVIIIGSVSLIYNAFAISVSERSRYLGMLSSVGATRRQKRNSVLFEAGVIGFISIPLGIISGIGGIGITFMVINPMLQNIMDMEDKFTLVVSPMSILIAAIVSFMTIYISAYIPARKASKITPIEAIRQSKDIKLTSKTVKTSKLTRKIFGIEAEIGLKNLKRNKGRYRTTVFSLVISIVLFLTVSAFSMYMRKSFDLTSGFENYNISIGVTTGSEKEKDDIYSKFTSLKGVDEYSINKELYMNIAIKDSNATEYIKSVEMPKSLGVRIVSLNKESFEKYAKEVNADVNILNNKENLPAIVVDNIKYQSGGKYIEGKSISVKEGEKLDLLNNRDENTNTPIGSITAAKVTNKPPIGTNNMYINIVVSDNVLSEIISKCKDKETILVNTIANTRLYINSKEPLKLQSEIDEVSKNVNQQVYVSNTETEKQKQIQTETIFSIFVYGFIALITAISIANIFNTISTSIALRKREFAMLKSIGMTPKDFNKMINYESIFYGIKSLMYGLPLSFIVMIILQRSFSPGFEFAFSIPWTSVVIAIVGVFLVVGLSMLYSSSKIKRENIIDALKQENI